MTRFEVQAQVYSLGVPPWTSIFFYDETYARPTTDYLVDKFWPWFWSKNHHKFKKKKDCDNSTRRYIIELQDLHAESTNPDEALSVGEFGYLGSSKFLGSHLCVIALTEKGVIFIDQYTGQPFTLTPEEIKTCFRCSF